MKGAEQIITMRLLGYRPASVYIFDQPHEVRSAEWTEDFAHMDVCTYDSKETMIDMRCMVGLPVTIFGDDVGRVQMLARLCKMAGAERITAMAGKKMAMWWKGEKAWLNI